MATTAESYSVRRPAPRTPLSAHPAFRAIVASWFAALLGAGSLALPPALVENLVALTGLPALIPSAAPPLGFTADVAIVLAGAVIGALLGLVLARKVAETHAAEQSPQAAFDEVRKCRPILAHEELGEEGLAPTPDPLPAPNRRPSLASVEHDPRGIDVPIVPLPGLSATEPAAPDGFTDRGGIDEDETSVPRIAGRPLAELGLLQLTERLGASLAERAARLAASATAIATRADRPFAQAAQFQAAEADDAARAIADFFAPGRASGADLRSDPSDDDGFGETLEDTDYSSLLAMKNPFTR